MFKPLGGPYLLLHRPVLHDALHTLADHRTVLNLSEGLLATNPLY
jgi:hypothetical protein